MNQPSFEQRATLSRMALSAPERLITLCQQATVYSLASVLPLERLEQQDPIRYARLIRTADAMGFPVWGQDQRGGGRLQN